MKGDSSETNKKKYFDNVVEKLLLSYVQDRFGFYKKMEDKEIRGYVLKELYKSYSSANNKRV